MAAYINQKSAQLMGVFAGIPIDKMVKTYYQEKFKNTFITDQQTILFDNVVSELKTLAIVPRDAEAPKVENGGFNRISITPDVIKGSTTITPMELALMQPGQSPVIIDGKVVDNSSVIRDNKLKFLKLNYLKTKEEMTAEIFLTGKLTLPISKDVFTFDNTPNATKTYNTKNGDWTTLLLELVTEYANDNELDPTHIEIGINVFNALMADERFAKQVIAYNHANISTDNNGTYPTFNILGYKINVLPKIKNMNGENIATEDLIILSNNSEFTNAYAGLGVISNGAVKIIQADVYLEEILKSDPVVAKIILQSAYIPVIPIPKRIKRYNLNITNK